VSAAAPTLVHALLVRKGEATPAAAPGSPSGPRRARIRLRIERALGVETLPRRDTAPACAVEAGAPR
jgi:hypothetical protein